MRSYTIRAVEVVSIQWQTADDTGWAYFRPRTIPSWMVEGSRSALRLAGGRQPTTPDRILRDFLPEGADMGFEGSGQLVIVVDDVDDAAAAPLTTLIHQIFPRVDRLAPDERRPGDEPLATSLIDYGAEVSFSVSGDNWGFIPTIIRTALPVVSETETPALDARRVSIFVVAKVLIVLWHSPIDANALSVEASARQDTYRTSAQDTIGALASRYLEVLLGRFPSAGLELRRTLEHWEADFYEDADASPLVGAKRVSSLRRDGAELRTCVDSLSRQMRGRRWPTPEQDAVLTSGVDAALTSADVAVDRVRADVSDAFLLVNTVAISRQLEESKVTQDRFGAFQTAFAFLTAVVLVPSLVAAIFGADVELPLGDDAAQWMWGSMLVGALLTLGFLFLQRRRS